MAEFPAFPLWTDAYLADTGHLTTLEHGAYLLLLMTAWRSGYSLPDDDRALARYARLSRGQWQRIAPTIRAFFTLREGRLISPRMLDELESVKRQRMQRSNAGIASAMKRKHRGSTAVQRGSNTQTQTQTQKRETPKTDSVSPEREENPIPNGGASRAKHYAFEGQIIKLNENDLETWRRRFRNLPNLEAELTALDAYYAGEADRDPSIRRKWFIRCASALANKDAERAGNGDGTIPSRYAI